MIPPCATATTRCRSSGFFNGVAASRFFGLAAMIVSAVFGGCRQVQDSLLYYPAARVGALPPTPDGYIVEPLAIVHRDSVELRGWLVRPTLAPAPLLIYYGGNAEEVSWLIAMAPRYGNRAIALMNYRGYGESGGRPSETALLADALAVFDKLNGRADIDAARVAVMGRSLGSGVAVHVVSSDRLAGVAAPTTIVAPETWFDGPRREVEDLAYNVAFGLAALRTARSVRAQAIYQRHTAFNCGGAVLARVLRLPLVLEFNSSELWKGQPICSTT